MSYIEFDNMVMRLTDGAADASESHGHLLGLLCANTADVVEQWLTSLIKSSASTSELVPDARSELQVYASKLVSKVENGALDFQLLLPHDDNPIAERTSALAHWCQGFLFGMAQGGIQKIKGLPGDCSEIIDDISELTKAETYTNDEESSSEEEEQALFELVEYVRIGTQLIYEELSAVDQTKNTIAH